MAQILLLQQAVEVIQEPPAKSATEPLTQSPVDLHASAAPAQKPSTSHGATQDQSEFNMASLLRSFESTPVNPCTTQAVLYKYM